VQLQVVVGPPDSSGCAPVGVYATAGDGSAGDGSAVQPGWTRHASGVLTPGGPPPGTTLAEVPAEGWPPPGAEPVDTDDWYRALAERGFAYGPAFQGLRARWRRGDEVFAEVRLPAEIEADAGRFRMHPALLDAALH